MTARKFDGSAAKLQSAATKAYVTLPLTMVFDGILTHSHTGVIFTQQDNSSGTWNGYYIQTAAAGVTANVANNNTFTATAAVPYPEGQRCIVAAVYTSTTSRQIWVATLPGSIVSSAVQTTNTGTPTITSSIISFGCAQHSVSDNFGAVTIFRAGVYPYAWDASDVAAFADISFSRIAPKRFWYMAGARSISGGTGVYDAASVAPLVDSSTLLDPPVRPLGYFDPLGAYSSNPYSAVVGGSLQARANTARYMQAALYTFPPVGLSVAVNQAVKRADSF